MARKFSIRDLRRYADLDLRRRELTDEITRIKAEQQEMRQGVLDYFAAQGIASVEVEEGIRLGIRRELWAAKQEGVETEDVIEALQAAGYGDLAPKHVAWQSLSALAREWDRDGTGVPEPLAKVLRIAEDYKVSARKSA